MGNSVSLRVWSEHDDDVIVNSPFIPRRQVSVTAGRVPAIVTSDSADSADSRSSSSMAMSASSASSASNASSNDSIESNEKSPLSPNSPHSPPSPLMRQCWICYGEEVITSSSSASSAYEDNWVAPCACKGTTKWVHQSCILDWIDSQLRTRPPGTGTLVVEDAKLACPQCHHVYRLHEAYLLPRPVLQVIDLLAAVKERFLIYSTLGLASTAIYTLAFSHGLWSGWMLAGPDFLAWIHAAYSPDHGSPLARLQVSAGVPLIPFYALSLTFPGMAGWLYPMGPFLLYEPGMQMVSVRGLMMVAPLVYLGMRTVVKRLIVRGRDGSDNDDGSVSSIESVDDDDIALSPTSPTLTNTSPALTNTTTTTTTTTSSAPTLRISILSTTAALLFPSASSLLGRLLCAHVTSFTVFQKSLVGAGVILAVRGCLRAVQWYQQERLKRYRRVLNLAE